MEIGHRDGRLCAVPGREARIVLKDGQHAVGRHLAAYDHRFAGLELAFAVDCASWLEPFRSDSIGTEASCFDAFSSREPVPTSLENALSFDFDGK
jgi:hypothetical protein